MATKKVRVRKPNEGEQPGFISKLNKYTKPKQEESQYSDEDIYKYIVTKIKDGDFPEQIIADLEKYKIPRGKVADTAYDLYDDYRRAEQKKGRASGKAPYDMGDAYGEETAYTEDEDEEDQDIQEAQDGGQFIGDSIFPKQTKPYYVGADAEPYDNAYKTGGAINKRSFVKSHIKKLKKAAEGDEVQNSEFYLPPTGSINDPMGKYTQKGKMFAKSVQQVGNEAMYKKQAEEAYNNYTQEMGGAMGQQDPHDPLEHLHIYGESLEHELTQDVSGNDNQFQFGGIKRLKEMGGNRRIRRANKALFGTPMAIPGVDVNYEFGPLGGLRKATADWDVSVLGDLVKFLPQRGGNMGSPFNTGYSMISTPAKMRDKVIKTVNNQALNEIASNTPGSTATQNNTTNKKAELTCPPGATYDDNKGYCVDMNGRMVFSPSTMLTKDPSELLTNPFANPYADQIPGSYQNLKKGQAKTEMLSNAGVQPLQANTQDTFNYAGAAFAGPDMSFGMEPSTLPGPAELNYSASQMGVDPTTYNQLVQNKRSQDLKRLNTFVPSDEPMESLPAEMEPIENNSPTTFKPTWSVNTSNKPQEEFCYGDKCFEYAGGSKGSQVQEAVAMDSLATALEDYDPKNFSNLTLDELKTIIKNKKGRAFFGDDNRVNKLVNTKEGERFLNKWLEFQKDRIQYFDNPTFKSNDPLNNPYETSLTDPSAGMGHELSNVYSDFLSRYGKFKPGDDVNMINKAVGPLDEEYENYQTGGFIDSENPDLYKFIYGGDDMYEEGGYIPMAQTGFEQWSQNRFNTGFKPRYNTQREKLSLDPAVMNPFGADGWRQNATQNLMGKLDSGVQQPTKPTTTQPTTTTTQPTTTTTNTTQPGTTTQPGVPGTFNFTAPPSRQGIFGLKRDFNYGSGFSPVNWQVPEGSTGVREVAYKDRGKWYNPFDTKRVKEYYAMGAPGTPGQPAGTPGQPTANAAQPGTTTQPGATPSTTQPGGTQTPSAKVRNVSGMTITNVEGNEAKGIDSKGRLVSGDFADDSKMNRQDRRYQRRFGNEDEAPEPDMSAVGFQGPDMSNMQDIEDEQNPSNNTGGNEMIDMPQGRPNTVINSPMTQEQGVGTGNLPAYLNRPDTSQAVSQNPVTFQSPKSAWDSNNIVPTTSTQTSQQSNLGPVGLNTSQQGTAELGSGPTTPEAMSQSNTRLMGNPFAEQPTNLFSGSQFTRGSGVPTYRAYGGEMDYMPEYMAYGGYMPEAKNGITVDKPEFNDPNYIGKVVEESAFSWDPKQLGANLFAGKGSLTGIASTIGNAIKNEKNFDEYRKANRSSDAASPNTGQGGFGSAEVVGSNMGDRGWLASNSGRNIQGIGFEGNEVITRKGGQLGSNYKKGSVYTLTAKQIQEIVAAGGKVEYIK